MKDSNRLFLISFSVCVTVLSSSLVALSVYVDPRAVFGTGKYPVIVATARTEKLLLLESSHPKPEALILGNSHCMRFAPEVVEEATGLRTFNLSVNSGKIEDFLALADYAIEEAGLRPKLIILGVCPRTFCTLEDEDFDRRLVSNVTLMNHLPLSPTVRMRKNAGLYFETLNYNYLKDVRKSISLSRRQSLPLAHYSFESDGFLAWEEEFNKEGALSSGPIEPDTKVTAFSEKRKKYFDILLDVCRTGGISLKIVITPYAPAYITRMDGLDGSFSRWNSMLIAFLESRNRDNVYEIYDFSRIEEYGGVDEFMGAAHPSIRNSTLMLHTLLAK
ncbi:MAG: hypothetical protein JSW66_14350 [Phycisphaerales bacterium]|nr:MAG: hypothetical protein JSW66_14350 [Phycisphaerales bacterium]